MGKRLKEKKMADVIVSSVEIRLRHPVHEAGQTNAFHALTQEWVVDSDGRAIPLAEKGPFTPQQLAAKGLTLPVIMDQALKTAVADRAAFMAEALGLSDELDKKQNELNAALQRIAELENAQALRAVAVMDKTETEAEQGT
jgi:hypothetical protein